MGALRLKELGASGLMACRGFLKFRGYRVCGLRFRVYGLGFGVLGLRFRGAFEITGFAFQGFC